MKMDQLIVTIFSAICFVAIAQIPIARVCRRNPVIRSWKYLIIMLSLLWGLFFVIRVYTLRDLPGARADSTTHEFNAHKIADYIRAGDVRSAFSMGGIGNYGFDFAVGTIYAFTNAPDQAVMALFTLMAFSGLLTLLDVLARSTQATAMPFWVVVIVCAYPEALFFASDTLKEGPVLWGACNMLRLIVPDPTRKGVRRWIAPIAGTATFMFLRPHIAFMWLMAIGATVIIKQRRWGLAFLMLIVISLAGLLMVLMAPLQFRAVLQRGMFETLEGSVHMTGIDVGGSQIFYDTGAPIPAVTGATLLFLRPFPWEAPHWIAFLAGAEAWFLTTVMIISWLNLRHWRRFATRPLMLTSLIVAILMAFFFTYIPNLGLVVRQRIQFFPAMMVLAATPGLIRRSRLYQPQLQSGFPLPIRPAKQRIIPVGARPMAIPALRPPLPRRFTVTAPRRPPPH
ncbi:MAG TPA: hypothetical protein VFE46_01335 [Pirellulales bacterium]|jgi:hypothetical protein|nr:hypothetical protein [Pirellulales bacterium]